MYGLRHRTVLVAALQDTAVGEALLPSIAELHGLGLVGRVVRMRLTLDMERPGATAQAEGVRVELTELGRAAALQELRAARWLLWRRLYETRQERAVKLRCAGRVEDARRLHARARRALDRARASFELAYGVST